MVDEHIALNALRTVSLNSGGKEGPTMAMNEGASTNGTVMESAFSGRG